MSWIRCWSTSGGIHERRNVGFRGWVPQRTLAVTTREIRENGASRTRADVGAPVAQGYTWLKERLQPEETRRQQDKLRDIAQLAEKLGCSVSQLSIAWGLKNESVQCLLLGAATVDQLYESIQSLQLVPKLNSSTMSELERILDNKPTRPPMVSTLALR